MEGEAPERETEFGFEGGSDDKQYEMNQAL